VANVTLSPGEYGGLITWYFVSLWVGLDYGEELHRSVKNFSPRQGKFEATVGMLDKMGKVRFFLNVSSWSSSWVKFLVRGFEVAQES
jgi:hypothetical protein